MGGGIRSVELAVWYDAGGVVDEAYQVGLAWFGIDVQVGAVQGVGLPHVVGMGFGECQAGFFDRALGQSVDVVEQPECVDVTAKGVGGDSVATQMALLDAGAVNGFDVDGFAVERGHDFLDGFQQLFGTDFAGAAFVGSLGRLGDAVVPIPLPPGLDGAVGELVGVAVFIGEDQFTDGFVALLEGVAIGILQSAEDFHFQAG